MELVSVFTQYLLLLLLCLIKTLTMLPLLCKKRFFPPMSSLKCHHTTLLRQSTTNGSRPLATKAAISMLLLLMTTFVHFSKLSHTINILRVALEVWDQIERSSSSGVHKAVLNRLVTLAYYRRPFLTCQGCYCASLEQEPGSLGA